MLSRNVASCARARLVPMNGLMRHALALAAVASATFAVGTTAHAAPTELAPADDYSEGLRAGSGWVSWSDGSHLVTFHNGQRAKPTVALRDGHFDGDIGTDAKGAAVITYSRCVAYGGKYKGVLGLCRLRMLELRTGNDSPIRVPSAGVASDTAPSMDHGNLVFSRRTKSAMGRPELVYIARGTTILRKVRTSATSANTYLQNVDLYRGTVTYIRSEPFQVQLIATTVTGGKSHTCFNGGDNGGAESHPLSPSMSSTGLWFIAEAQNFEDGTSESGLGNCSSRVSKRIRPDAANVEYSDLAVDGNTMYTIRGSADGDGSLRLVSQPLSDILR